jgi:hypothetical protein
LIQIKLLVFGETVRAALAPEEAFFVFGQMKDKRIFVKIVFA